MEILYYNKINHLGKEKKYAKFNEIEFYSYHDYYRHHDKNTLHHYVYCYYNNIDVIPKGYVIHHIDFNKQNNDISNLQLLTHSDHSKLHSKLSNNGSYITISEEQVDQLIELKNKGLSLREITEITGFKKSKICDEINRRKNI
jgi:hypothetical protein